MANFQSNLPAHHIFLQYPGLISCKYQPVQLIAGLYRGFIVRHVLSRSRAFIISLSVSNPDNPTYASKYFLLALITFS